jgi:hypothetical protein
MVEVRSPVSIRVSAVGSRQSTDLSPGARSNPSRGADARRDAMPGASHIMKTHAEPEPSFGRPSEPEPATAKVVGPGDKWSK